jgi:hypothetical protein
VHHRWDHQVLDQQACPFEKWFDRHTHLIWFDVQRKKLEQAVRAGKTNYLVVLPHRLERKDLPYLSVFDRVLCPSRIGLERLRAYAYLENLLVMPWDSGLPMLPRLLGPVQKGEHRLMVVVDGLLFWRFRRVGWV